MTDRYHTLTVVLEHDMRDDDCASTMAAIAHVRGVLSVTGVVSDPESWMAETRAKAELRKKLLEALK